MKRSRLTAILLCDIVMILLESAGLFLSAEQYGAGMFRFYTQDSNLFALLVCLTDASFTVRCLKKGEPCPPAWVRLLKYLAACCLAVTFLVVLLILLPMLRFSPYAVSAMLLVGSAPFLHVLCPLLLIGEFLFLELPPFSGWKHVTSALVPTCLYAAAAMTCNLLRILDGPYPFLRVLAQPVWMSVLWGLGILGGCFVIAWLFWFLNRQVNLRRRRTSGQMLPAA